MTPIASGFFGFLVMLILWRQLDPAGILFFQGLVASILAAGAQLALTLRPSSSRPHNMPWRDSIITLLASYAFMFTVPTTVDRAYSVRLIEHLGGESRPVTKNEVEAWFATQFATPDGVERRLKEQMATGSVSEHEGGYALTARGHALSYAFTAMQRLFACGPYAK